MKYFLSAIFFLFSVAVFGQVDKIVPAKPSLAEGLVVDKTNTLTGPQKQALNQKLIAYDDSTSSQIAVVIVNSLEGYDISEYAMAVGRKWGVGGSEFNNGVVILVAKQDRKMRIEVGYGLEGAIPDVTAKSIIENSMVPEFKQDNYYRGLDHATDDIIRAAAGEYKAPANYAKRKSKGTPGSLIGAIVLLLIIGGISAGGRGSGGTMSGAGWIIGSMLGSSGRSSGGGWSGGSSGGGFGGFGGGSFGGGGASGSW